MRISDWSSDVCSSDLRCRERSVRPSRRRPQRRRPRSNRARSCDELRFGERAQLIEFDPGRTFDEAEARGAVGARKDRQIGYQHVRSEEHTSELQSLMRNSYAVVCLKKKKNKTITT